MKDLGDVLQWLLESVRIWLQCAAKPVTTLNAILPEVTDENHLTQAAKVWVPSLLISFIISFPVLKAYGIEWNNIGYHLSWSTTTIIALVASAFIVHHFLLGLKLKSEFVRTLVIYTVLVTTYTPVTSLLAIPSTLSMFAAVQEFKQRLIPIADAVIAYFQKLMNPTSTVADVLNIAPMLATIFSVGVIALFAESVSQWYGNNRFKCYSAVAASLLLSGIVIFLVVTPLQLLIIHSFMGIAPR